MMKLKSVLAAWSFSLFFSFCFAQTIEQTKTKADSLLTAGLYQQADVLYDRMIFFADSTQQLQALEQGAVCKAALNKFAEAAQYYKLASKLVSADSLYYNLLLQQALCLVMDEQFETAQKILTEILLFEPNEYYKQKSFLLKGIIETQQLNFLTAKIYFDSSAHLVHTNDSILLYDLLNKNYKTVSFNPNAASFYSAVLPGLGQSVHGDFKNGINSFVINAALITAFVYTGMQYNFISSFLFFSVYWPRFYIGGIAGSKDIANHKLKAIQKEYLRNYLKVYLKY